MPDEGSEGEGGRRERGRRRRLTVDGELLQKSLEDREGLALHEVQPRGEAGRHGQVVQRKIPELDERVVLDGLQQVAGGVGLLRRAVLADRHALRHGARIDLVGDEVLAVAHDHDGVVVLLPAVLVLSLARSGGPRRDGEERQHPGRFLRLRGGAVGGKGARPFASVLAGRVDTRPGWRWRRVVTVLVGGAAGQTVVGRGDDVHQVEVRRDEADGQRDQLVQLRLDAVAVRETRPRRGGPGCHGVGKGGREGGRVEVDVLQDLPRDDLDIVDRLA